MTRIKIPKKNIGYEPKKPEPKPPNPCDICPKYDRYMIGKTSDGKIVRYNCKDNCKLLNKFIKETTKQMVKNMPEITIKLQSEKDFEDISVSQKEYSKVMKKLNL